ncbi:MAG: peptidoglycan-binding domain-containing protein [Litoreibacter sp.]
MILKQLTMACAATSLLVIPSEKANADGRDFAAGIVAGVVGSAIVRNAGTQKRVVRKNTTTTVRKTKRTPRPGIPSTSEGAQLQTALNYFGYNAGRVDGQVGSGTRNAVRRYQASMGYVSDGYIDGPEQGTLLGAYNWATNGGAAIAGGVGGAALLREYQQRVATNTLYQAQSTQPAVATFQQQQPATQTIVLAPQTVVPTALPVIEAAAPEAVEPSNALPNFLGQTQAASLASHCNQISLVTSTNGGFSQADNVSDANFALNEQFCLARTYAIAEGEQLAANVQGFSATQIQAQCQTFGPAMKDHVAALSIKPVDAVLQDVSSFVLSSGMSPAQLSGTAKICLSVGYRTDDMDVAIGSGLLLTALGEPVYGELMGHHLTQGFGASKRNDLALAWYERGLSAVEGGATAVFAPGQPERTTLIRRAAYMLGDTSQGAIQPLVQPVSGTALPTFNVSE